MRRATTAAGPEARLREADGDCLADCRKTETGLTWNTVAVVELGRVAPGEGEAVQ